MTDIHLLENEYESAIAELRAEYKRMDFSIEAETRFFAALERVKDLYNKIHEKELEALKAEKEPDPVEPPIDPEDTPILPMQPICSHCGGTGYVEAWQSESTRCHWCDGTGFTPHDVPDFDTPIQHGGGGGGDPLGWMTHFSLRSGNVRRDYRNGHRFMRRMKRAGVDNNSVLSFVHDYIVPNAAFEAGLRGFVYSHYRDHVRYFNEYHWQNKNALDAFENRITRAEIDKIPF